MKAENVPHVLAVMAVAGLYDDSGKWLYRSRRRGKSGGGIIAVSPGKFGIAVVSPPLDEAGNSVKATRRSAGTRMLPGRREARATRDGGPTSGKEMNSKYKETSEGPA